MTDGRKQPNGWCLLWTTLLLAACIGCWGVAALMGWRIVSYWTGS